MLHNVVLFLAILLIISPLLAKGLTLPLTPPTSPRSPFYTEILEINNISTTTTKNVELDQTHYLKWLIAKTSFINDIGEVNFQRGAGYHVIEIYMGHPVQLVYGIFDTGSDISWFQCEGRAGKTKFTYYNQTKSLKYKDVVCGDSIRCDVTNPSILCRTAGTPCGFKMGYEDGSNVVGVMSSDIITFKPDWEIVDDFYFGCSTENSDSLMGFLGAGNGKYSLPQQLYTYPMFSYCISADLSKRSLVKFGPHASLTGQTLDMVKNSRTSYYYIKVKAIKVNNEDTDVNIQEYQMSEDGKRGFIIDSGATFTHLSNVVFDALQKKIEKFLGPPTTQSDCPICYPSSTFGKWWSKKTLPIIAIQFMNFVFEFPNDRVWAKMPGSNMVCLLVHRAPTTVSILGLYQLLDVNVGYDPINNLIYLQKTTCPSTI